MHGGSERKSSEVIRDCSNSYSKQFEAYGFPVSFVRSEEWKIAADDDDDDVG